MIGKSLRVHQFGAQFDEALIKTVRLGDAAETGEAQIPHEIKTHLFPGENILEVKGW